jgi:hypothetical protein
MALPTAGTPLRLAFVGQGTFFEACVLEDGRRDLTTAFFEFRKNGDAAGLLGHLRDWAPDVVIVFRPEIVPAGLLDELPATTLGFLTEPLPRGDGAHDDLERRLWELEQVDAGGFDRVVAFDPNIVEAAARVLPVWRSVSLPVADRFYRPVGPPGSTGQALFVGRSTPHREALLEEAKHHHDVLHLAFGVGAAHLEELMGSHQVAINLHNEPYPSFENRVCLHLAAGHLVLSEPLHPLHGLEPGIDFLEITTAGRLAHTLAMLERFPGVWHAVRVRGRRKAEQFRASRVYPRLVHDLLADVAAFGGRR